MNANPDRFELRVMDHIEEMRAVERVQDLIWPGTTPVPDHMLLTAAKNGGLVIGAWDADTLAGFAYGFIGFHYAGERTILKHCSHMLAVLPEYRDSGLGARLKRAQWQMVRQQGLELITWTYDPLQSRNAHLNIAKLGGVCNTYFNDVYGEMPDGLNSGLPTDRFQVNWWVNSDRVNRRLSRVQRTRLDLANFISAGATAINSTQLTESGFPIPHQDEMDTLLDPAARPPLVLFEIPADFQTLKETDPELALNWRMYSRTIFDLLFSYGYLVTDFIHLPGDSSRSYYVLS